MEFIQAGEGSAVGVERIEGEVEAFSVVGSDEFVADFATRVAFVEDFAQGEEVAFGFAVRPRLVQICA